MSTTVKDKRSPYLHADFRINGVQKRISTKTADPTASKVISGHCELFARKHHGKPVTRVQVIQLARMLAKSVNTECMTRIPVREYLPKLAEQVGRSDGNKYRKVLVAVRFGEFLDKRHGRETDMWEVTPDDARSFLFEEQKDRGLSACTVRDYGQVLHVLWGAAVDSDVVERNIMAKVKLPKRPKNSPRRAMTLQELRILYKGADDEWKDMIADGLCTGLRIIDVSLQVREDVDLEKWTLRIKALKPNEFEYKHIPPSFRERFRRRCAGKKPQDPLFPRAYRLAMDCGGESTRVVGAFRALVEHCRLRVKGERVRGVERIGAKKYLPLTFQCLRHTFTTLLKVMGTPEAIARAIVGHRSAAVSDVYTHIGDEYMSKAVEEFPDPFTDLDADHAQLEFPFACAPEFSCTR